MLRCNAESKCPEKDSQAVLLASNLESVYHTDGNTVIALPKGVMCHCRTSDSVVEEGTKTSAKALVGTVQALGQVQSLIQYD